MNGLGRNTEKKKNKQPIFTKETIGIVLLLFSVLCFVFLLTGEGIFGKIGLSIKGFLLGVFGYFAYAVFLETSILSVLLFTGKKIKLPKKIQILFTIGAISLVTFLHVISMGKGITSFGEYLKLSYKAGLDGFSSATPGGFFDGILAFLFLRFTMVGGCVILGLIFIICNYFILSYVLKFKKIKPVKKEKFDGAFIVKKENETQPATTTDDAVKTEINNKSSLFVVGKRDFDFMSKREAEKNLSSIRMGYSKNGLGVARENSYTKVYQNDLEKKIEYIKTPAKIKMDKNLKRDVNGTSISDCIVSNSESENGNIPLTVHSGERIDCSSENKTENTEKIQSLNPMDKYATYEENAIEETPNIKEDAQLKTDITEENTEITESMEKTALSSYFESLLESKKENVPEEKDGVNEYKENSEPVKDFVNPVLENKTEENAKSGEDGEPKEKSYIERLKEKRLKLQQEREERERQEKERLEREALEREALKKEAESETVQEEKKEIPPINRVYFKPPINLLKTYTPPIDAPKEDHEGRLEIIKNTLSDFHINVEPQGYVQGPSITRYEMMMPAGVTVKSILRLDDDLKMRLATKYGVRIEAPIPGKNSVGVEVANQCKVTVGLKELLEETENEKVKSGSLKFAIGKDIVGKVVTDDLSKGPHFLIAGTTGSGKSVCLNVMIVSLIMRYSPEELRLILIDPKGNEFRPYEHIPHLMIDEIITEPKKALAVFSWAQVEMERRYGVLKDCGGVRDIDSYNENIASDTVPKMPKVVIVVDELSNLMETCKREMEARILSIAQKARAVGIHLVLATQRPSVDVITGTIKANLPSRIALKVTNFADSNTILAEGGAEKLLGYGDMLYKNSSMSETERYQGAWICDDEINNIVKYIIENNKSYYDDDLKDFLEKETKPKQEETAVSGGEDGEDEIDDLYLKALWVAVTSKSVSISLLQRKFQVGWPRAGGLLDKMERMGFVSGNEGSKARRVLLTPEEYEERFGQPPEIY